MINELAHEYQTQEVDISPIKNPSATRMLSQNPVKLKQQNKTKQKNMKVFLAMTLNPKPISSIQKV